MALPGASKQGRSPARWHWTEASQVQGSSGLCSCGFRTAVVSSSPLSSGAGGHGEGDGGLGQHP